MENNTELFQRVEQRRHQLRQQETQARRVVSDIVPRGINFQPDTLDSYYVLQTMAQGMLCEIHGNIEEWQSSQIP